MANGKWIERLTATTPLVEAAQLALLERLQVVRNYLPKALEEADKEPEYVHQLRVGTRRADATLRIFAPCLPDKVCRRARRRLRRLRRAAGAARDLDVFVLHLLKRQPDRPEREQPGLDYLVGDSLGERIIAQEQLRETGRRDGNDFDDFMRDLILAVRPGENIAPDATLLVLARPLLSNLLQTLAEKAGEDLTDYPNLHQVRIAGKRLRYAMEVFACCFGPAFRVELYPAVEEMQEILGRANDHYVGSKRLTKIREYLRSAWPDVWSRAEAGVDAALQHHQKSLPTERRRFLRWWKKWQADGAPKLADCLSGETAL
jgi:CHAD domain-containing protein